jgi:hypothetical protein
VQQYELGVRRVSGFTVEDVKPIHFGDLVPDHLLSSFAFPWVFSRIISW